MSDFKDFSDFFEKVGDNYLHPTQYGEIVWPISVEELYQHFKSRILCEIPNPRFYGESLADMIKAQGKE
jgi:hypothetical protein